MIKYTILALIILLWVVSSANILFFIQESSVENMFNMIISIIAMLIWIDLLIKFMRFYE